MSSDQGPLFAVDITNCDREPIHLLGGIQPFGFMVVLSSDWLISRASANVQVFLGAPAEALLGQPVASIFTVAALHALRNRITLLRGKDAVERLYGLQLCPDGPNYDVALHFSGQMVVMEAEPAVVDDVDAASLIRSMTGRLAAHQTMAAFLREGARQVRALTGFDRVMVYRFDHTGSGEVVAEALRPGIESFLGLNYPASDIPQQARALYLRNIFRIIADVSAEPVPIVPMLDADGAPLDQSLSILRSVSPIHLEYLRNMGIAASLSISIIVDGRLWGLFACHNHTPILPSFGQRSATELFGQMFSLMLESRERRQIAEYELQARAVADRLMAAVAEKGEMLANAQWLGDIMIDTIPADGVGVFIDGKAVVSGLAPSQLQFAAIVGRLNQIAAGRIHTTDHIASLLPEADAYASRAAGLLAIPLSRSPRDYVVLFRAERLRSVRWAGEPVKQIEHGPNGPRLTPRKSFEEWSELVKGHALPFTSAELRVAETLRSTLLEVVLRLSDSAGVERKRAQEQQELLIAELNHRVRNILSLIRGLISQTRHTALSTAGFVDTLDSRVQALARAHDQITADHWGPARLIDLIETEAGAYVGDPRTRIRLDGPNVLIEPQAFTALALVFHELITNATKYGALSSQGLVTVSWRIDERGSLHLSWVESGGPAVTAPIRRGFGSTIIERSIPYELGGESALRYRLAGFEADFVVPARFVSRVLEDALPAGTVPARKPGRTRVLEGARVLLVEDSMIIALDSEDALRELGATEVHLAASSAQAIKMLTAHPIDFAVLDFNLGAETSVPVADALLERGIRFVFATGYGDEIDVPDRFHDVVVLKKPYNVDSIGQVALAAQFGQRG